MSRLSNAEPRWICLEGMNADELAAYDYGSASCLSAVVAILDGKDQGIGECNPPWREIRQRLIALVQGSLKSVSETTTKSGSDQPYSVTKGDYWRYDAAPRGVKVFLLTKGGVAVLGEWKDDMGLIAWHPLFDRDKELETKLGIQTY